MNIRISVRTKLFLSHILIVLFIAGTAGTYFYLSAVESLMDGLKERLQASAALISQTLDAEALRHIRTEEDTASPEYVATLDQLRTLKRMNPDIAFIYVMRLEAEKIFFVIDSDETNAQALPGKKYAHVLPSLQRGFTSMIVDDEIVTDEWGSFLSGYAPIKNAKGAVFGRHRHARRSGSRKIQRPAHLRRCCDIRGRCPGLRPGPNPGQPIHDAHTRFHFPLFLHRGRSLRRAARHSDQ